MRDQGPVQWRFLDTGPADGFTNMAVDEALLAASAAGAAKPTLRFYTWSPPALSLGYGQAVESAIDIAACRVLGIDMVRRPSGGRAVLHEHEVTYSVVIREDDPHVASGILAAYLSIARALIRGLSYLHIKAELLPLRPFRSLPSDQESPACFNTPASYEVAVGGRKLIGSAQRRINGVILQHGSIPISLDLGKLFALLRPSTWGGSPTRAVEEARTRITSLQEAAGRLYPYAEVVAALSRGFAEVWEVELVPGDLTSEEREASARLRATKYSTDGWTWRR